MSKNPKQGPSYLKMAETRVVFIVFDDVLCLYRYHFVQLLYMNQEHLVSGKLY